MGRKGRTLRGVLKYNTTCKKRFEEAETLANRIFDGEQYKPLPFYTEHGAEHCQAVERFLEQIIWKNGEGKLYERHDFIPSPEEAMYLLSAVWLHDIGMWHGILDNEQPGDLQDAARVVKLREEHEVRASRYIHDKWTQRDCSWWPEEKNWLANICVYHRSHYDMSSFQPVKERARRISDRQTRLRLGVVAALVRLADACHVDKRRAPQRVMGLYISLGMAAEARGHWERADLIKDVRFDHDARRIELTGHYPREFGFGLGKFVVQEVGEMICDNVRGELRSVQQTLSAFSNTDLRDVKHIPLELPGEERGKLDERWLVEMRQIMEKTQSLREHDFMVRNLCIGVRKLLPGRAEDVKSVTKLTKHLKRFMKSIEENSSRLVNRAGKIIRGNDVLVLYGHSVNVCRMLRRIDRNHSIYIVDCYRPLDGRQIFDENKKILETVVSLGFARYKFLQLEALAAALNELKGNAPCKILLGTHGRLKSGDLLCKVGSYMIAETAKRFGAEVIALCETAKFLVNSVKDDEIAGPEQLFSSEAEKPHPDLVDVPYVAPKMDRVPKRLVDMVVTEKGVEKRRKVATRAARSKKRGAKGKKANKAT
jgi:translation initiation factor 2B subunit (eIF-2B alpha/beta/delta family)